MATKNDYIIRALKRYAAETLKLNSEDLRGPAGDYLKSWAQIETIRYALLLHVQNPKITREERKYDRLGREFAKDLVLFGIEAERQRKIN